MFEAMFEEMLGAPPPTTTNPKLRGWLGRSVAELVSLDEPKPSSGQCERDRLFSTLVLAIAHHYFNGNKNGRRGHYPWNEEGRPADGPYLDADYLGHNIAALAVDGRGRIIDFDFNHNALFNSSAQHAETRLVRRLFALSQLKDETEVPTGSASLRDVTVYTTLESCAQCSGVMALAQVKRVVYLQTDPGTYWVGRILRNLTDDTLRAPLPVAGSEVGLPCFERLNTGFSDFTAGLGDRPFFTRGADDANPDRIPSVTSFLCTKAARDAFGAAADEFRSLADGRSRLTEPGFADASSPGGLTNAEVLARAVTFLGYACSSGRRGTPHGS